MNIVIIDYGMGNTHSVMRALQSVAPKHHTIALTNNPDTISQADKIVFPGQGAANSTMQAINQQQLTSVIMQALANKPFLGICMGLQVLLTSSEENNDTACLQYISGTAKRFPSIKDFKIPHLGWNSIDEIKPHYLINSIPIKQRYFYFVHSYYAHLTEQARRWEIATTTYSLTFPSMLANNNVALTQFHPEKSGASGLQLLSNFCAWKP
ncbi:MAG: imidazole glycerol phosphate synthase subunit HisH [Methylacidiphilales bacterium]|nr:imidazole glycerol phosphate synthase subunit HisH [Candidatus Methylacidiphilales bacterium]